MNLIDTLEDMQSQANNAETVIAAAAQMAGDDSELGKLLKYGLSLVQILAAHHQRYAEKSLELQPNCEYASLKVSSERWLLLGKTIPFALRIC